ncbi:hypothetical protein [Sporosarcina aquimarina]|uniref:Uncharacterized protein n=1 Tax=Sporosarcina aquimarina TaxID=114975 RepID=A0ABU4G1N5_9BACL|nr:hypothetical protein [Sporosarcina aquimarina]MDW0110290.1 hypothetical protein [Sporosarcina aquimarina]
MTASDEIALTLYLPIMLFLIVIEIVLGAYESSEGYWNKKLAAGKLLLNMSWTCTLFPLLLDTALFQRMIEALYEGRPDTASPLNEEGLSLLSVVLVISLFIVNTVDVYQSYQTAEKAAQKD